MVSYASPHVRQAADALVALVNTQPHAHQGDTLADGSAVDDVLDAFAPERPALSRAARDAIIRLREAIARTMVEGASTSADEAWVEISELTRSAPVRRVFTRNGVALEPAAGDPVIAGIAAAIQAVVDSGCWSRLRLCAYRPCNRAFFDTTRSRTQRWHSYEECGNRANVSAYRARVNQDQGKRVDASDHV